MQLDFFFLLHIQVLVQILFLLGFNQKHDKEQRHTSNEVCFPQSSVKQFNILWSYSDNFLNTEPW